MAKVGDLIKFSKQHYTKPGIDYVEGWMGVVVKAVLDSTGVLEELHILWRHGNVSDYDATWWNKLDYEPFEVISSARELNDDELEGVRGGMSNGQFDVWRCGVINESG